MTELSQVRSRTTDPGEADLLMRAAGGSFAFTSDPGEDFRFEVRQDGDDDITVGRYDIGGTWVAEGGFDAFCLASVSRGEYEWESEGVRGLAFRAPFLVRPGYELYGHGRQLLTTDILLSAERLAEVARTTYADDGVSLVFESPIPISIKHSEYVLSLSAVATEFAESGTFANDLVRASLFHALAVATLECFRLTGNRSGRPQTSAESLREFRRAVRFIEDNASLPITIGDIAQAAGVAASRLSEIFRDRTGAGAGAYLRRVRLAAARDELLGADASVTLPAIVALRWGFGDPDRFARHYLDEFGETPRQTLER